MNKKKPKIAFIGCGNMGEALIKGLLSKRFVSKGSIIGADADKKRLASMKRKYSISTVSKNIDAVKKGDIIILAVKPQIIDDVLREISSESAGSKLFISIAAGVSMRFIESFFKKRIRLIRVMPNTPALIQEGIAALSRGKKATKEDMKKAEAIFNAVGKTVVVNERLMDAVTGLSGSGPAYLFSIIEALTDAGVKTGLSRDAAYRLSVQTALGSIKMLIETGESPSRLREMVTSPGGTTIAGLKVFKKECLKKTIMNAVGAATKRSKELGEQLKKKR